RARAGEARLDARDPRAHALEADPLIAPEKGNALVLRRGVVIGPGEVGRVLGYLCADGALERAEEPAARGPARGDGAEAPGPIELPRIEDVRPLARALGDADRVVGRAWAARGELIGEDHGLERQRLARAPGRIRRAAHREALVEDELLIAPHHQADRYR